MYRIAVSVLAFLMTANLGWMHPSNNFSAAKPVTVKGIATCFSPTIVACSSVTLMAPGYYQTIKLKQFQINYEFTGVPRDKKARYTISSGNETCDWWEISTTPTFGDTIDVGGKSCLLGSKPTTKLKLDVTLLDPTNNKPINAAPKTYDRPITIDIYDSVSGDKPITTIKANAAYEYATKRYLSEVDLSRAWLTGDYMVRIKLNYTLTKYVSGILKITADKDNSLPQTPLIAGDVNQNNSLSTSDYQIIEDCVRGTRQNCIADKRIETNSIDADVDDNGKVDYFDLNIWLRIYSSYKGAE